MTLTENQAAIKQRLEKGMGARAIGQELGISRNAVYQQIQRMRRDGELAADFTPTGVPTRERLPETEPLASFLTDTAPSELTGILALIEELRRIRDELDVITRRITRIIPRRN